jgi:hypothetical protein
VKHFRIGKLSVALLTGPLPTLLVDWNIREPGNRRRLEINRNGWLKFSVREGYSKAPKRLRLLGFYFDWYGKGVE